MKKSKLSESQIVAILKEGEAGIPVAQLLRHLALCWLQFLERCQRLARLFTLRIAIS